MARVHPRQVEAFRALMLTSSTTRAAEVMHVTQPAISRLVKDFQTQIGLVLFERDGNRLTPTADALALYAEVERSYVGLDRIAQAAKHIQEHRGGRLRITGMPALTNGMLPRLAGHFLGQHPRADIAMFGLMSHVVLDWVISEQCDMGFAAGPIEHPLAVSEPLPTVRYVGVVPSGHPLARKRVLRPEDYRDEPYIALGPTTPSKFRMDELFARESVPRRIRAETPLSEIACAMVSSGQGISVVDPFTAREFERRGVVARRFLPAVEFQVTLLYSRRRGLSPLAREFAEAVERSIREFKREFAVAR